jgi:hypothetical protein
MASSFIYALCEPGQANRVRYIGIATEPRGRLRLHEKSGSAVGKWIDGLRAAGLRPVMVLLAEIRQPVLPGFPLAHDKYRFLDIAKQAAERAMIERFHVHYAAELLNITYMPDLPKSDLASDDFMLDGSEYESWLPQFRNPGDCTILGDDYFDDLPQPAPTVPAPLAALAGELCEATA